MRGRKWTEFDDFLLSKYIKIYTRKQLSELLNRSESAIRQRAINRGLIHTRPYKHWTTSEISNLEDQRKRKESKVLASEFNRTKAAIEIQASKFGMKKRGAA